MKNKMVNSFSPSTKSFILVMVFFLGILSISAQPQIQWQKSLGGTDLDEARSSQQTTDGGYIIAGWTESNNGDVTGNHGGTNYGRDYWVVKLDSVGTIQWQKSLGGTGNDVALSAQQTTDGGYIIAGASASINGDVTGHHGDSTTSDYWVVKLNTTGNIQWQKSLGGTNNDIATSIKQTVDGGYVVFGSADSNNGDVIGNHGYGSDYWVVKLDSVGAIQWQKSLGGANGDEEAHDIQQTTDGGYILAGYTNSNNSGDVGNNHGDRDYWIIKLGVLGNVQWKQLFGGTVIDEAFSVQEVSSGYIVIGATASINGNVTVNHGSWDYWLIMLSANGTIQWQKSLGGTGFDDPSCIRQTTDGGYIIAGSSASIDGDVTGNHGSWDYWIVKTDSVGAIQWQKSLGGTDLDEAKSIQQTIDGGYVVAGRSRSNDGDVTGNHGSWDYWIVKLFCTDSTYMHVFLDTIYTSHRTVDTSIVSGSDTTSTSIIYTIDSIFITTHVNATKIVKDSTVFTINQCTNITSSVFYMDTVFSAVTLLDTVVHESRDTVVCGTSIFIRVVLDTVYTSTFLSVDTAVKVRIDTVIGIRTKVIITTDSVFTSSYLATTRIMKDSTIFSVNQCDSSIITLTYLDTVTNTVISYDTVTHQSSDTVILINTGIQTNGSLSTVKVYPNPFTNQLFVDVGDETTDVVLFDALGRLILQTKCIGHVVFYPDVLSGIYFLRVTYKNKLPTAIKVIAE